MYNCLFRRSEYLFAPTRFPYPELNPFFHPLAERFQHEVIDDNPQHRNPDAQQLLAGERVTTEKEDEQDEERQQICQNHSSVAGRGFQQQLHSLPHPVFLAAGVLHSDDLLPAVGRDADALGMAATARGTHDDFHADFVAINGADDAFSADVMFFVVHNCFVYRDDPTLRLRFCYGPPRTALRLYEATKLLPLRGRSRNYIS